MKVKEIRCKSILSKSGIYGVDYSINPYIGCQHACRYCYAVFMRKYTEHKEPWGQFVDVKVNAPNRLQKELSEKKPGSVLLSSVTDPYQPLEKKYKLTRRLLKLLANSEFSISVLTKSSLVTRDVDLLQDFPKGKICVGFTINFDNDSDRKRWEPFSSPIEKRIESLKKLSGTGISTYAHVGPWLEGITDLEAILSKIKSYIDVFQVENLNLRRAGMIKKVVSKSYPKLFEKYKQICENDTAYKKGLKKEVRKLRELHQLPIELFID